MTHIMPKHESPLASKPVETGFDGIGLYPGFFGETAQRALVERLQAGFGAAPPYRPRMPRTGRPWSILQTNFGQLGWVSRPGGYAYSPVNDVSKAPWPAIPAALLALWDDLAAYPAPPECCLVNLYDAPKSRMGLHRDEDEEALDAPVLSLSLGDTCIFRVGGFARGDKSKSFRLASGDVLVLGGASRLRYHGVDRVISGSSRLIPGGGRINLTLRRVTRPA
ncbi:2OG-Fe(II) oxygenase [Parvibaculum lavamentivorans DS-1]|uniref:2OG-Fe(II) oxygenase n=1 Tax=Parvibaculum lavamentivorans (strain DS-1 / DSM 13023 / NCIMB 13966) TaxID=402881 RepID=A7HZ41_PARL1|nr:alpha-ketoglutarate-dependent dioxygenase AlkB [Parvibaculum lavamentivorans]ABS65174.1 2OG-Fe(II) oxygenase [Parvibaculum lavamentivorans DS-1]